jgi:CBS domain containing-hemolysin-like protein
MGLLLFYLFLAIAVSFLCSIMEAVILSTSTSFIQTKKLQGNKSADLLQKLKENIDIPLSAILTINTVAHTIGAAGVGAQAVAIFGEVYFGIISAILTLLILVFSEIIPKTIGAMYWRTLALPSTNILQFMIYISYPLVVLSKWITRLISKGKKDYSVSREEVAAMTSIGTEEGVFEESEKKIITNLIKLRSISVKKIMTPRTVLVAVPEETTLVEFFKNKSLFSFSRIPVYTGNIDNISGYVLKYQILEKLANDEFSLKLKDIKRDILVTYSNAPVPNLFEQLLDQKEHIALVVDEYGGVDGIVTMEDVIETLLGLEIIDESDGQADMQKLALERWHRRLRLMNYEYDGITFPVLKKK